MKSNDALALLVGMVIGAAVGHFVTRYFYKEKLDEKLNELQETMDKYNSKKLPGEEKPKNNVKEVSSIAKHVPITKSSLDNPYSSMVSELKYKKEEPVVKKVKEVADFQEPYVCNPDVYADASNGITKMDLYYYEAVDENGYGQILCNIDGEIVGIPETIGPDALTHFGIYEPDIVHVMNEKMNTVFEVTNVHAAYSDEFGDPGINA